MRVAHVSVALLVTLSVSLHHQLAAQRPVRWHQPSIVPSLSLPAIQEIQSREKSPELAGVLNLLLPGAGSFYAGNSGHGIRHLVIGSVTLFGIVAGATTACQNNIACDGHERGYEILGVSALGYLVNGIWGAVTAVGDAKAYNRSMDANAFRLATTVFRLPNATGVIVGPGMSDTFLGVRIAF